jgi:hypothetical protein
MVFPMAGRLQSFTVAGSERNSEDFDIGASVPGPISIVVSEKVGVVVVSASAPSGEKNGVVLLVPADPLLTSRESCFSIKLTGPVTTFPFVPQGRYRVLAFNEKYSATVAGLAPRYPDFLKDEAAFVEATPEASASAAPRYVADENMEEAIRLAGGPYDPFKAAPQRRSHGELLLSCYSPFQGVKIILRAMNILPSFQSPLSFAPLRRFRRGRPDRGRTAQA